MKFPKLIVIGLDALPLEMVDKFTSSGVAPVMNSLLQKGVSGRALPDFPPYTPNNWTAIATGASSAVSGTLSWWKKVDGEFMSAFDSRSVECETIFQAASRQNLTTLAVQYPGAYPPPDPVHNITLVPLDKGLVSYAIYSGKEILSNVDDAEKVEINIVEEDEAELNGASEKGMLRSAALQARRLGATEDSNIADEVDISDEALYSKKNPLIWSVKAEKQEGKFIKVMLTTDRGETMPLPLDEWSRFFVVDVPTSVGLVQGLFRIKAYSRPLNGKLRLAISEIYRKSAIASDPVLGEEIIEKVGGFIEHSAFARRALVGLGSSDFHELWQEAKDELAYQVDWIANAAKYVLDTRGWDLFYLHWHWPDTVLHHCLHFYDPAAPGYTSEKAPQAEKVIEDTFRLCDRLASGLLKCAGPDTVVCLVSDHGNSADHYNLNITKRLENVGLICRDGKGKIDKSKSQAVHYLVFPFGVTVNTEERGGPVKASEFEKVQEKIIDALLDWKTPEGRRVIAVALKRKDSVLLNYWGKIPGDVFFHANSGFYFFTSPGKDLIAVKEGAHHGGQMPTTYTEHTSNMAFFTIAGPGFKEGYRWNDEDMGPFRLIDLLPTLCKALGIEPPGDVTGAPRNTLFD